MYKTIFPKQPYLKRTKKKVVKSAICLDQNILVASEIALLIRSLKMAQKIDENEKVLVLIQSESFLKHLQILTEGLFSIYVISEENIKIVQRNKLGTCNHFMLKKSWKIPGAHVHLERAVGTCCQRVDRLFSHKKPKIINSNISMLAETWTYLNSVGSIILLNHHIRKTVWQWNKTDMKINGIE